VHAALDTRQRPSQQGHDFLKRAAAVAARRQLGAQVDRAIGRLQRGDTDAQLGRLHRLALQDPRQAAQHDGLGHDIACMHQHDADARLDQAAYAISHLLQVVEGQMVHSGQAGRGHDHGPVAVAQQEGQGHEQAEVQLVAPAALVDVQGAHDDQRQSGCKARHARAAGGQHQDGRDGGGGNTHRERPAQGVVHA
jgi:hypothetical protein